MSTTSATNIAPAEIDKQIRRGKTVLRKLKATLEDLEDRREIVAAKNRNRGKTATPCAKPPKNLDL